jgi:hypothetical protein
MMQVVNAPWQTYGVPEEKPSIRRGDVIRAALAALILLALVTLLASTYVGHSPGPYGACYASNGRSVPCELVGHKR